MGGLKKFMPVTFATMLVGWLAISGVPLLSGFFSKDEILFRTFTTAGLPDAWPKILWIVGAITALLTAVYMTRLMVLTFWGSERFSESHAAHHDTRHSDESHQSVTPHGVGPNEHEHHAGPPRESPRSMTVPLVVLAIGAVFAGYLGVPEGLSGGKIPNYFERILEPSIAHPQDAHSGSPIRQIIGEPAAHEKAASAANAAPAAEDEGHGTEIMLTVISVIIAFLGIGIGWSWFNRKPLWQPPRLLEDKYYVDEIYNAAIVQPIKVGSTNLLWKIIDVGIIDGAVNGAAYLASRIGNAMRYMQLGLARGYVALVVLGALLIIGYFIMK